MNRYVCLVTFTDQGAKDIKHSTQRAHAFNSAAAKSGVTIENQYWTIGGIDGVLIISAEDSKKALHCVTELASHGNIRTETLQAFDDKEFDQIAGS